MEYSQHIVWKVTDFLKQQQGKNKDAADGQLQFRPGSIILQFGVIVIVTCCLVVLCYLVENCNKVRFMVVCWTNFNLRIV